MADRLVDEIHGIEEHREAFSSAVGGNGCLLLGADLCENQLSDSLRVLNESVRDVLYPSLCFLCFFFIVHRLEREGCEAGTRKCGYEEPRGECNRLLIK